MKHGIRNCQRCGIPRQRKVEGAFTCGDCKSVENLMTRIETGQWTMEALDREIAKDPEAA